MRSTATACRAVLELEFQKFRGLKLQCKEAEATSDLGAHAQYDIALLDQR
jgi:hypothetical protein